MCIWKNKCYEVTVVVKDCNTSAAQKSLPVYHKVHRSVQFTWSTLKNARKDPIRDARTSWENKLSERVNEGVTSDSFYTEGLEARTITPS